MSEKYVAKKYVASALLTDKAIKCPNCHQSMTFAGRVIYCMGNWETQSVSYRTFRTEKLSL